MNIKRKNLFIQRLKEVDPSLSLIGPYVNNMTKVLIKTKEGFIHSCIPKILLKGVKPGIATCIQKTQFFKYKLAIINKKLTVKSEYIHSKQNIIVSDYLGIHYKVNPTLLLRGTNPTIATAVNKNTAFKLKAESIHGNKYIYTKIKYISHDKKVKIICPEHGVFYQLPFSHLNGYGCPECGKTTAYKRSGWIKICERNNTLNPKVYVIRCYNEKEEFIKIGITIKTVAQRFQSKSSMPYSYEILKEIKGSADFVWDKEKELHKLYKQYSYKPLKSFDGQTECFTINILTSSLFN